MKQGDAQAQNKLGLMYYVGEGVKINKTKAVEWLTKAADQGDSEAISALEQIVD
ncbi:MAG: SEL1-like repeat protein [Deltaproteobacteria bacterium]|jgi:TPR repeat protein|nr:SEL1-like repeat protein [Deltaproteobacteria bacterium]